MESELRVVADQFEIVAPVIFVVASLGLILWSARRRRAASTMGASAGLLPALITGVLVSPPLVLLTAFIALYYGLPHLGAFFYPNSDQFAGVVLSAFLLIALSVLDVYAIWPPVRRTFGDAAGRATLGVILAVVLVGFWSGIRSGLNSATSPSAAAVNEYLAAERRAVEARSAGLSIHVAVLDVTLGATNSNGRLVSYLTLDITVRSTTQIQVFPLNESDPITTQGGWIRRADSLGFNVTRGFLGLPAHIPAGFDETYRVEAPLSTGVGAEYYTTGPWEAHLYLIGPDATGSQIRYEVTTVFTVPGPP